MTPEIPAKANAIVLEPAWWDDAEWGTFNNFSAIVGGRGFVSVWRPEPHEMALLQAGGAIFVTVFTDDGALPISVAIDSKAAVERDLAQA